MLWARFFTNCSPARRRIGLKTAGRRISNGVCQTDPLKPSEAAPGLHGLRGDLDNIVLKALEKQPDRRYLHVEQLSEDIERHLDGRMVIARPDTIMYRLTKFCRRHKFFAASAAAILVTLTGGIIAVSWQARIARRERAVAERRFEETRKLAWTLLFEIDPDIANLAGRDESAGEIADAGNCVSRCTIARREGRPRPVARTCGGVSAHRRSSRRGRSVQSRQAGHGKSRILRKSVGTARAGVLATQSQIRWSCVWSSPSHFDGWLR